ncbi:hypothetical protein ID866_4422 [Astraeus odoratus]|nr:hypothetical protein ID866_4422 [Astraeus odoratus]
MPPIRRLESIVLPRSAAQSTRIWTEMAYSSEEASAGGSPAEDQVSPVQIQFRELMDRVNQRGRHTRLWRAKVKDQIALEILQEGADNGHLELYYREGSLTEVETVVILPAARDKLTGILRRMRGFPDLQERTVYQGALALTSRNFLPDGNRRPTKAKIMRRNAEKYVKLRDQGRKLSTRSLSIQALSQASFVLPPQSDVTFANQRNGLADGVREPIQEAPESMDVEPQDSDGNVVDMDRPEDPSAEEETQTSTQLPTPSTPSRVLQPFNWVRSRISGVANIWYMTPESLLRHTTGPLRLDTPATPSPLSQDGHTTEESPQGMGTISRHLEEDEVGGLFQQNALFEGHLATINELYKEASETAAAATAENIGLKRKLAKVERELESLHTDAERCSARLTEITLDRDNKAAEVEQLTAEMALMAERLRTAESILQTVANLTQAVVSTR